MFYGRTSIYERDYTFDLDFNIKKKDSFTGSNKYALPKQHIYSSQSNP